MRAQALLVLVAACDAPPTTGPTKVLELADLIGTWRWQLHTESDGTTRVEDETWTLGPGQTPTELRGAYVRRVEVRSLDRRPFVCNQRDTYVQRARFEISAAMAPDGGVTITETGYAHEPSPCDHGFRHVERYAARLVDEQLELQWQGGAQTLRRVDTAIPVLAAPPWTMPPEIAGDWSWEATSYDATGYVQSEREQWQITSSPPELAATYRRRVTVRSPDGSLIECANAPSWTYEDTYVLDGRREEEHWHFYERAVDPDDHPCLRATPERALDEATAEQLGDYLVLEWRGKRRQVLSARR